jgi:hypothetical protein
MNPRDIEVLWRDQFDWIYRETDYAVYAPTVHPDVSGRPQNLLMLERLIGYINAHEGVRWMTLEEVADDFRERQPSRRARQRREPETPVGGGTEAHVHPLRGVRHPDPLDGETRR